MIKIALIGHDSRNDNLGVGALTVANVTAIRRVAQSVGQEIEMVILIGSSGRESCVSGPDITERIVRPVRKPWGVWQALRDCDLVVEIAGGDSFSDIYGSKRIYQILLPQYIAHIMGLPLIMAPQTIGPFKNRLWRALAKHSIRRSAVVTTRDSKSTAYISEIGLERDVIEASDVALRLPYTKPLESGNETTRIGLNISGLLMMGGYSGKNMFDLKSDYPNLIRNIITYFTTQVPNCEVHLVGHVIAENRDGMEDDYAACLALARDFPQALVAPAFKTPQDAKSYISGLDFFMGARMHACIAAFSSGVPVVPMAYSRKFEGLFGTLGYSHIVDCTSEEGDVILKTIIEAYDNREELARNAQESFARGLQRLDAYDKELSNMLIQQSQK